MGERVEDFVGWEVPAAAKYDRVIQCSHECK